MSAVGGPIEEAAALMERRFSAGIHFLAIILSVMSRRRPSHGIVAKAGLTVVRKEYEASWPSRPLQSSASSAFALRHGISSIVKAGGAYANIKYASRILIMTSSLREASAVCECLSEISPIYR